MKRVWTLIHLALVATFVGLLMGAAHAAQNATGVTFDLGAWAADIGALGVVVAAIIGFARKKLIPSLDGIAVQISAVAAGTVIGIGLHFLGYFDTLAGGAIHGLQGGLASFISVDALRQIFGRGGSTTQTPSGSANLPR